MEALKRHRARQAEEKLKAGELYRDQDLVFAGQGMTSSTPDLRHTCASLLFQKNVHPRFVQEPLGHASVSIALDTYSRKLPGMGGEAFDAMEDAPSGDHCISR